MDEKPKPDATVRCRVCGRTVNDAKSYNADGQRFCSERCMQKYLMKGSQGKRRPWC